MLKIHKKYISKKYVLKKPCVIVTKKRFFELNRTGIERKPTYLNQHLVYVKMLKVNGENKEDFVEVINGRTGIKWGMGDKGSK